MKDSIVFFVSFTLPMILYGQLSFSLEVGLNNYNFIEKDPGGFSLNTEDKLQDRYFGLCIQQQLSSRLFVGVNTYYSFVSHKVELHAPNSFPILGYKYNLIDVVPTISFLVHQNVRIGIGTVVQNQVRKRYTFFEDEEESISGRRGFGYLFSIEGVYKKISLSLSYKQLTSFSNDRIFQYSKFTGIRAGIRYRLVELFSHK